jgi:transcriptional regulator with XRE-family HTH domain
MDFNTAVAAQIRADAAAAGISNAELARRAGVPVVSMNRYLTTKGEPRPINVATLAAIAAALGLEPGGILDEAQRRMESRVSRVDYTLAARDTDDDAESEAQQIEP